MSQKLAQVELGSAKVQAVETAPTARHFLQTLPSLSISLFSIYKGKILTWRTFLLLIAVI
jgi:hypothetical protein